MKDTKYIHSILILFSLFILASCSNESSQGEEDGDTIESQVLSEIDSTAIQLYKFDNTLFSVPSPYQISILIKDLNIEYNPKVINPVSNAQIYNDNFKKALNLGVYGADLAYLNMNNQLNDLAKYFATIKILAEELQLSAAFERKTIERIEENLSNEDSLLHILSKVYRNTDRYLKENNRNNIGVLVLTGGWVESVYFLAQISELTQSDAIMTRLGEQKYPLENLIKILTPYYNDSDQYASLIESLVELAYIFDGIDIEYIYEKPETDSENKITTIKSSTQLLMNVEHINMISKKVNQIRTQVIN